MDPTLALVLQALLIGAALAIALFGRPGTTSQRRRRSGDANATTTPPPPPYLPGLPLLGNCIALGRSGAAVLLAARRETELQQQDQKDCFAVRAFPLAPPLVFVFHPKAVASFFAAPEETLAFKPAVRQFTERVFGLPADEFSSSHEPLLDALRALLSPPARLRARAATIATRAAPLLDAWAEDNDRTPSNSFDLWHKARTLVFQAAGKALFGDAFFARHGAERLQQLFLDFEGNFERAASPVPHFLLGKFSGAKKALLRAFAESLESGDLDGTVAGELAARSGVRPALQPSLLLSVLWASQANSMPAFFWALAFLLRPENKGWLERVREAAAAQEAGADDVDGTVAAIEAAVDPSGPAQRVANEAIRARAHSIAIRLVPSSSEGGRGAGGFDVPVAAAAADTPSLVRVPPGSILAVCPFETHADERFFSPTPAEFDPSRPPTAALPGGGGVGMGFGGGFWRCPGRLFAGMELGLLLTMAVTRLDISLAEDGSGSGAVEARPSGDGLCWWERAAVFALGERRARYGLGVGLQEYETLAPVCPSLSPPADLKRLVGFKVPAAPLRVVVVAAAKAARRRKNQDAATSGR
jgi:cytochrome P450